VQAKPKKRGGRARIGDISSVQAATRGGKDERERGRLNGCGEFERNYAHCLKRGVGEGYAYSTL